MQAQATPLHSHFLLQKDSCFSYTFTHLLCDSVRLSLTANNSCMHTFTDRCSLSSTWLLCFPSCFCRYLFLRDCTVWARQVLLCVAASCRNLLTGCITTGGAFLKSQFTTTDYKTVKISWIFKMFFQHLLYLWFQQHSEPFISEKKN